MAKNTHYYTITSADTIPASSAGTGTITSSGVQVTGSGTSFLTQLQIGDFIFDATTNKQVRRVQSIGSATVLYLDEAFTADVAGIAFRIAVSKLSMITVIAPTGSTGNIDNSPILPAFPLTWSAADKRDITSRPALDPIVAERTAGTWSVLTTE